MEDRKSKVLIFVSSTFTDTKAERNMLMKGNYCIIIELYNMKLIAEVNYDEYFNTMFLLFESTSYRTKC